MANHHSKRMFLWLVVLIFITNTAVLRINGSGRGYWPKENWRVSTPEAQGMDSGRIYAMLKAIAKGPKKINSLLIIRNGYLVTEAYFNPYHKNTQQFVWSSSKSISSVLIGVALREGLIKDIRQRVLDIFPEGDFTGLDERQKALTIEDLLSIYAGKGKEYSWQNSGGFQSGDSSEVMLESNAQLLVKRLISDVSGNYENISKVFEAIIQKSSRKKVFDYARDHLFKPIGITNIGWPANKGRIDWDAGEIYITPRDMARYGYLYLRRGIWNGKRLVPAGWVKISPKERIHRIWNPCLPTDTYGCHYWIEPYGFSIRGLGGQYILALPNLDIVLVFTGSASGDLISSMIEMFIIPAVKSNRPLPQNPEMANQLSNFLREIEYPKGRLVPALPATAKKISGKVYLCSPNQGFIQYLSFYFQPGNVCRVTGSAGSLTYGETNMEFQFMIGLDGVYRTATLEGTGSRAFKGYWADNKTFVINYQDLRQPERIDIRFTFHGARVEIEVSGSSFGFYEKFEGRSFSFD
jgi:CubicO group peptidase (beta-lactamase class C family)